MIAAAFIFLLAVSIATGFLLGYLVGFEAGKRAEFLRLLKLIHDLKTKKN